MSDASERFLDLATKPLEGNPELQVHARWELGEKLKVGVDDELEDASKRLEQSDQSKWKPKRVLWGLILFGVGLLGLSASMWMPQRHIATFMLCPEVPMMSSGKFDEEDKLMVSRFRGEDQMFVGGQFHKLQELHPSDPKYFAPGFEYELQRNQGDGGKSLLAKLKHVIEIDPDNGWWPFVAAAVISKKPYLVVIPPNGLHLDWLPEEHGETDLALRLYHKAASSPRFDNYLTAINTRMLSVWPPANNVQDSALRAFHIRLGEDWQDPFAFHRILEERAQKLEDQGDIPNFRILLNDWIRLNKARAKDFTQLSDLHLRTSSFWVSLPTFIKTAKKLGLHEEAFALEKSKAALNQLSGHYPTNTDYHRAFRSHGSLLTSYFTSNRGDCGMVGDYFEGRYPPMTVERLKPNRRSEHAYIAQLMSLPLGLLLLVATTVLFLFRFRTGRLCGRSPGGWLTYLTVGTGSSVWASGSCCRFFTSASSAISRHSAAWAGIPVRMAKVSKV